MSAAGIGKVCPAFNTLIVVDAVFTEQPIGGLTLVPAIFGTVLAFENDLITGHLLRNGAHRRRELALLLHVTDPGDVVIDIGAHIGSFTIPLAQRVGPAGKVLAVEADPRNYALLVANTRLTNVLPQVSTINTLIGSPARTYAIARHAGNTGMSNLVDETASGRSASGVTVDHIAGSLTNVSLLKIVLQGMELNALEGAEAVLRSRPIVSVQVQQELLKPRGASAEGIDDFLRPRGYRFFENAGDRNLAHDNFEVLEVERIVGRQSLYHVLAIPAEHPRLARIAPER